MGNHKFLLINPWVYDFALYDLWMKPLGILRIARILKNYGEVFFIDCLDRGNLSINTREDEYGCGKFYKKKVKAPETLKEIKRPYFRYGMKEEEFLRNIENVPSPDFTFITTGMTYWYIGVKEIVNKVKKIFPETRVFLGGIYATLLPNHAKNISGVDGIFTGKDEDKLSIFLKNLLSKDIKVPYFPIPDLSLLGRKDSWVIETSRGCPFRCSYCASHILSPHFLRRKREDIIRELNYLKDEGVKHIVLYDDAFLIPENEPLSILDEIIENKFNFTFHTPNGLHARFLTSEIAEKMREANFKTIRLSLETSREDLQKETGGKVRNKEFENALKNLSYAGYYRKDIGVYIMLGLPGSSQEDLKESILYVHSLGAKVILASFSPIPGTLEWEKLKNKGIIKEEIDPLWHNNTIFPLKLGWSEEGIREFRLWVSELNKKLDN